MVDKSIRAIPSNHLSIVNFTSFLYSSSFVFFIDRWRCGVDDPVMVPHIQELTANTVTVPQIYETPTMLDDIQQRRLTTQTYVDSGSFVPIQIADSSGWTRPIRIAAIWDVIDSGDPNGVNQPNRMCSTVGDTIEVQANGNWIAWTTANFPATSPCSSKSVVSAVQSSSGWDRYNVIKARTNAAISYWQSTLKIKRTQDNIVLDSSITTTYGLVAGTSIDADLVLVMTARPSPASPIAGFAVCLQRDQRGRCTVGQFNWVPEVMDIEHATNPDTIESDMHTALHELMHVLGGMSPGATVFSTPFLDNNGNQRSSGVHMVEDDPAYGIGGKKRTLIITPKVANFTRTYLNCPTAAGFPLEDVPLGKGSHWEARLMGPELMSYGSGTGQVYISDVTLGFLEDTNQYIVDYSKAGPIVTTSDVDDFADAQASSFLTTNVAPTDYIPPPPPPPGALRWGNNAGCDFMDKKPKESWPSKYLCPQNKVYGCTPDHRMSAVCIVKGDYTALEQTCGGYYQNGSGPICNLASVSGVPSYMQPYATDADAVAASGVSSATAGSTGGYNNAMDYVPVYVGYWNCMYANPKDNSTAVGGGDTGSKLKEFVSSFGSALDMETFGGQARCPQCRCLSSSLMELTKGYNPQQPQYGLCYRVNCYRPDYLQIAIRSMISSDLSVWYSCPAEGGKLYIPGFTGTVVCPKATEFCANEVITGIRYPEQNRVLEAIFWGGLCAVCFFLFLICIQPCLRDRVINCTKSCCGVRVFEVPIFKNADGGPSDLPKIPSRILLIVNMIALLAGLGLTGACGYAIYVGTANGLMPLLAMGILTTMLAGIGVRASCKKAEHGPSCYLLTYLVADILLITLMLWTVIYSFAFTSWTDIAEDRYDTLVKYLPAQYTNGTRAENLGHIKEMLQSNVYAIAGVFIGILGALIISLGASGRMINARTLISIFVTFVNNIMLGFGILMIIVGFYLVAFKASVIAGAYPVVGLILTSAFLFVIIGSLGHAGVFKRNLIILRVYMVFQVVLGGLAAAAVAVCFNTTTDVHTYISKLDDKALGAIASALGFSLTSEQVIAKIQNNLHQLGLAFAMVLILQIALFINTLLLLWAFKVAGLASTSPGLTPKKGPIILGGNQAQKKGPLILGTATAPRGRGRSVPHARV